MLFSPQEIQAMATLLNRLPMSPAEILFTNGFLQRLVAFCQPPKPEPEPTKEQAMADALAIAEVLDAEDEAQDGSD